VRKLLSRAGRIRKDNHGGNKSLQNRKGEMQVEGIETLTVGSLFSGIGGIELGLERTGRFKTIWNCEIEPYPSAVLKERFPGVPNLGDITKVNWYEIEKPDVVCGGFPCQDISVAGKGKGIVEGKRSSLWSEFARCLRILRPRYALVENVPMLAKRGLSLVLADLAAFRYNAEWEIISAAECGAPHRRERLFIIAHSDSSGFGAGCDNREGRPVLPPEVGQASEAYPGRGRRFAGADAGITVNTSNANEQQRNALHERQPDAEGRTPPNPDGERREELDALRERGTEADGAVKTDASDPDSDGIQNGKQKQNCGFPEFAWCKDIRGVEDLRGRPDIPEPLLRRTDDGLSSKLDRHIWRERVKSLGNAVVPACAETVGRRILELEANHEP